MKLLAFLLCVTVASATITITPKPKSTFVPHTYQDVGKSFLYKYKAFLNTTFPQSGVEFIGMKFKCDVELTVLTTEILHMNLSNILVKEKNGTFNSTLKDMNIPYPVNVSYWNSSLTQNYTEALKNPITFQYVNGKIVKVFSNKTDPEWVVNFKKGILNMLIIQLDNDDVFSKKEEGISGTCETNYHVMETRTKDNIKVFNITKVRDLNNCTDKPQLMTKTMDLKDCKECDKELTEPFKAMATFKYNVTGERNKFFIENATSVSSYVMTPRLDLDKGSYAVYQYQKLKLMEVRSKKIIMEEDLKPRGSIKMIFPEIVNDLDKWNTTLKKVEFFVNLLSNHTYSNFTAETPSHFIHLVRSLRECNITQLRQVWNWTEKTMYKRDWVIKALPYVNKTDMTQLVKEMFFNRTINMTKWHAEELLTSLGSVEKPTVKMIQDIRDICEMDLLREPITDLPRENVTKTIRLRHACFVSLGSMIRRFRKSEKFVPSTLVRSLSDCEETWMNPFLNPSVVNKETYDMLMELRKESVKLHCVEAMGNAGLPDHVEMLKETIKMTTDEVPMDVRLASITSLRHVCLELPKKVHSILLKVLKDPTEDVEMRIESYLTMVKCEPTPAMLTLITEEVNKWTNLEVKSFVSTHLKNLAKSTDPSEKKLAMAARYAVLFLHPIKVGLKQSQHRRWELFSDDKMTGGKCELSTVFDKQNIIPRKVNAKCDFTTNGQAVELLEWNMHTDSLNDVIDRVFGKYGSWSKRKSIFDMMKEKRVKETLDYTKLELAKLQRKVDPYTKKTWRHASTKVKMFDTDMYHRKLDDLFFNDIMDVGKLSTKMIDIETELMKPQTMNFTKVGMIDINVQWPTVMGLPISLNRTIGTLMRVMVNTTFSAQPSLQDASHTDLVAKVNVTPELVFIDTRSFGCHTPLNKLVAETNNTGNFTMALSTKLTVDYDMKKYSLEFDHLKKDRFDILTLKHNVSLIHEKTMCGKGQVFKRNITVINGTQTGKPTNLTMCFQQYSDSAKLCLNITTFKTKRTSPLTMLSGPMTLEVFAKKGMYNPDKIVLEYEPRELERWRDGIKQVFVKLRSIDEKQPGFVERYVTADIELEDRRPTRPTEDLWTLTTTMMRNDIPDWRAKIRGFQRWTEDIEVDCQWGMPKDHVIRVNDTDKNLQREYYLKFVSDRWILTNQTIHNMTLLWGDVPGWMKRVGTMYQTWVPMVKAVVVNKMTPWDFMIEPKQSWIEKSYTVCMKSKSNETMDLIFVMPNQEITITNMTSPVHTAFLKRPLPTILGSIVKPNITFIPPPKTCHMSSSGIQTFDNITVKYTLPGNCPHVLVKDCSTDERFTVLVQNVTLREERDKVHTGLKAIVYVSKRKFELITRLDSDLITKKLDVKVDGVKKFENWEQLNVPEVELEVEDTNTTLIRNATHIKLISGQGFSVVMCVMSIHVNVSQRHWNTTCGLCGNNDDIKDFELRTPFKHDPTHVKNDTKFGISWVVQGDDCQDPECKLKKFKSFPLSRIESDVVMIGDSKAACFSKEPVFYCPEECSPVPMNEVFLNSNVEPKKKVIKVGFSCIKTDDPNTTYRTMRDQSFTNKPVDIVRDVEVPQRCNCLHSCIDASRPIW